MNYFLGGIGIGVGLAAGLFCLLWLISILPKPKDGFSWTEQKKLMERNCEAQEAQDRHLGLMLGVMEMLVRNGLELLHKDDLGTPTEDAKEEEE